MSDFNTAREFAQFIKGLGFRAFVAGTPGGDGTRGYGLITDATGERVLSFGMEGGTLGGNYNGDQSTGSGWRIENLHTWDLRTAEDVKRALYALAPGWTGFNTGPRHCHACGQSTGEARGGSTYRTLEQYLKLYGSSSKFQEV